MITYVFVRAVAKKRYQAVGFPCNRMLKLSSSRGIRIDIPVLSVSWSFEDHSVIIQALKKGLIEHEASDTGGVPRWQSSCPDRLAEATCCTSIIRYIFCIHKSRFASLEFSFFRFFQGCTLPQIRGVDYR